MDTIARIHREYAKGRSIRGIAKNLRMSRHTVRRYLRSGETEAVYERQSQHYPRLEPYRQTLEGLLAADEGLKPRERRSGKKLYEALVADGYRGSYDAVQRYARAWRKAHRKGGGSNQAYVPLSFEPGEAYQFDWSEEWVVIAGVVTKVQVAHMRLCYSRMPFVRVYPRQTQEMVFDAHKAAFSFFGGACARGIYDNMRTAVDTVFKGKERQFNRRFQLMCSHYLIEPTACTPASGWEKGQVEKQVNTLRSRFFTPRRHVGSTDELNRLLVAECESWARATQHPDRPEMTVWEAFQTEQATLAPVTTAFDGFAETNVSVSRHCLIRFDRNQYSVDARAAGRTVQVRAYADRIVVRLDGEVVAEHERRFGRGHTVYDPLHYIPILARKPGALRNGAPFKGWRMPSGLSGIQARLGRSSDADRQFAAILATVPEHGLEAVEAACQEALAQGLCSRDAVLNLLNRRDDPAAPESIATPANLALQVPPEADPTRYDGLRLAAGEGNHGTP